MGTQDPGDFVRPQAVGQAVGQSVGQGVEGPPAPRRSGGPRRVIDIRHDAGSEPDDPALRPYLTGRLLTAPAEVLAARALHAEVFVTLGWLPPAAVAEDGSLRADIDPWGPAADWFGSVRAGAVKAVARTLGAADDLGRLPVMGLDGIPAHERRSVLELPAEDVVEVSALARHPEAARSDAPAVMAGMWRESLRRGHRAWLMAVDTAVFGMLRRRVVGTAIRAIGPEQAYLGSPVVPALLRFEDVAPAQLELARRYEGDDPLPPLLPRLFPAASPVRS